MGADDLTKALQNLAAEWPQVRLHLTDQDKDQLVAKIGPRTAQAIVRAKSEVPLRRIPFLFSSVDTQAVLEVLANDMQAAIQRGLAQLPKKRRP